MAVHIDFLNGTFQGRKTVSNVPKTVDEQALLTQKTTFGRRVPCPEQECYITVGIVQVVYRVSLVLRLYVVSFVW